MKTKFIPVFGMLAMLAACGTDRWSEYYPLTGCDLWMDSVMREDYLWWEEMPGFDDLNYFQDISGDWLVVGICVLLGLAGFNLGIAGNIFEHFKGVGYTVAVIPVAAVAGSFILAALYSLIASIFMDDGLSVREAVAVSAGFGWYTFAPGLLSEAGFEVAGAVSFMHNVIRETLGLVLIPLIAKKIGYLEAVCVPGVAAMDVCLPLVERSCRKETVVYSFCTGALMCVSVPVVVTLCIGG